MDQISATPNSQASAAGKNIVPQRLIYPPVWIEKTP